VYLEIDVRKGHVGTEILVDVKKLNHTFDVQSVVRCPLRFFQDTPVGKNQWLTTGMGSR
jgi:competence transcription factor ComK